MAKSTDATDRRGMRSHTIPMSSSNGSVVAGSPKPATASGASRAKVVAYTRVSSAGQLDGHGLERQRESITAYAKAKRFEVVAWFEDGGVSGTLPMAERPALSDLFVRLAGNGVRTLIVESASRLARDMIEGELALREFKRIGCTVLSVDGNTELTGDAADPTTELIRRVLNALADWERSTLVAKMRRARDAVRAAGRRAEGPAPFGATDAERAVVARARVLRRKPRNGRRRSLRAVGAQLDAEGFGPRGGGSWSVGSLARVLARQ